ncbi:putative Ig domain-containing protein [Lysobacter capsici]|uniref:putative Ig domain-containing protein n=1 Tax=Lysobacter capsici TaxID=435897 RepID=UPI00177EBD6C|nr:putative Ig domain-containing protein [Lysobacter capsici]UOF15052.1 putative Ig domain-containing protein [Lysobacter capsici]
MSAVISGNGLGLFNSSASQLGTGLGGRARFGQGLDDQYVNIATGNLILHSQDEQLLFRGMTIGAQRTYNSRGLLSQVGGDGWITGFERRVELLSGTVNTAGSVMRRHTGDGSYQDFTFVSANTYRSTTGDGAHDTLTFVNDSYWAWVEGSSLREERYADHANATYQGRLTFLREQKSDGAAPTSWNVLYDANGRITEVQAVETGSSEALLFGYDANGRLISLSTRSAGVVNGQVTYEYDGAGRLSAVLVDLTPDDPSGDDDSYDPTQLANNDGYHFRTVYTYVDASSLQLSQVRQSDGTLVSYTYDAQGRIKTLTRGDSNNDDSDGVGNTLSFSYDPANRTTEVADSTGRSWAYVYDAAGQLLETRAPAVSGLREVTQYSYDASGNLTRIKTLRGASTLSESAYQYDANGNLLWQWDSIDPATGAAAKAIQRTYSADNQLTAETVYTGVDADGALAGSAPSGGLTTTYVYDSRARLRFVVDAAGAVQEYEYDTSGNGIGQLSKTRRYLGAAYTGARTLTDLSNWTTPAQRAQSTLTVSSYDLKGRLSGTWSYATVDASGNGVENDAAEIVQYLYNAQGLLTQRRVMRSSTAAVDDGRDVSQTTTYLYDGMNRLLSEVVTEKTGAAAEQLKRTVTAWIYQDSGASVRTIVEGGLSSNDGIASNDLVRVEVRNQAGVVILVSESALSGGATRSTNRYYDNTGRLRASQDASGALSYVFYDEEGQVAGEVDATGAVREFVRDDLGRVVQIKDYVTRVDTSAWLVSGSVVPASLAAIRPAVQADDRKTSQSYDALGRLTSQDSGIDGAQTLYSYDGAGRLVQTSRQDIAGTTRTTRYFYDAQGRQTGQLDAEGYLVEHVYDLAGRRIATTAYATATVVAQRAGGSLAQLRPAAHADDQTVRWFHDGRDNVVGQLDAEGYFTEFVFDQARNQRAVRAYALKLTGLSGSEAFSALRTAASADAVRETRRSYDEQGRLIVELNPEGTSTQYSYDVAGRLIRTQVAAGTSEVREGRLRYNVFGELIGELGGKGAPQATAGMSEAQLDAVYAQYGVRHSYDALGRRSESIDAAGNKTWYFYDKAGRPTFVVKGVHDANGVQNAQGEVVETRYTAFGDIQDVTAYTGRIAFATAGSAGAVASALSTIAYVAAADSRRSYTYTARGRVATATDAEGAVTRYTYNAFDERTREERAFATSVSSITDYQYDKRGLLIQRSEAVGTAEQRAAGWVYDAFGRALTATDARGNATAYAYDRLGRQIGRSHKVTYGAEVHWSSSYDAFGRVLTTTDANGNVTAYAYDDANRSLTLTTPEGNSVVTVHNRHGQSVSVTEPVSAGKSITRSFVYDLDGNLIEASDGAGGVSRSEYDARGLLSATVDASGRRVELRYDAVARLLQRIEDPAGLALTTHYAYDGQGRQLSVTDASGRVSSQRYDRNGRLLELTLDPGSLGLRTSYAYDAQGRQITVTDPDGRVVQYAYDALDRRISERVDPNGLNLTTGYVYDNNDNLIRRVDAGGAITRYVYDEANRLIYTVDPLGVMTRQWFDQSGKIVAVRTFVVATDPAALSDATTIQQLDTRLSWTVPDLGEFRVYDKDGRLRLVLDHSGAVTETSYDRSGRVVATRRFSGPTYWDNDLNNQMFAGTATPAMVLANAGVPAANDATDRVEYRIYDDAGRVRLRMDGLGGVTVYAYDAAGRVVEETRYAQPVATAQLASVKAAILNGTADLATVVSYIPAGQNQLIRQVYDAAGRSRYSIDATGAVTERFYDGAGRVVATRAYARSVTLPAALLAKIRGGDASAHAELAAHIASSALADDARDLRNYTVHDSAGRARYEMDAQGFVIGKLYDGVGRLTVFRRYLSLSGPSADLRARMLAGTATTQDILAGLPPISGQVREVRNHYDAGGRLRYVLTSHDASSNAVLERRYDNAGRVIEEIAYGVTIPINASSTLSATATAVAAAGGASASNQHQTRYVYDIAGRLRFAIDDAGAVVERRYDGMGRTIDLRQYGAVIPTSTAATEAAVAAAVAGQTDVRSTRTAYDGAGRVLSVTDALNKVEAYTYDSLGQVKTYTNKNGHSWDYGYDAAGRRVSQTAPAVWVATVDNAGNQTYASRRIVERTEYDALGNVTARIENADTAQSRVTRYEYDSRGHQIRTVLPDAGRIDPATGLLVATGVQPTLEVGYDALGRAVVQKDTLGNYSYKVYDDAGRLAYDIDAEGYVTRYRYNGFGEQTQLTRYAARWNTAALTGWSAGQAVTLTQLQAAGVIAAGANDRSLTTSYDLRGLAVRVDQSQVAYYTQSGTVATGTPTTVAAFDGYGRKVKESVLLEGVAGQADAVWAHSYFYYDELDRVTMTVDAEGYVTRNQYNANGELTETIEYARAVATANLSGTNPPALPAAGDAVVGYDRITRFTYDAMGRKSTQVQVRHYHDNNGTSGVRDIGAQFGYDGEGNLITSVSDAGTTTTVFDALGRAVSVTEPVRSVVTDASFGALAASLGNDLTSAALYQQVTPFTEMIYDAFGNAVQTRRYGNGRTPQGGGGWDNAKDQVEKIRYDGQGRAVVTYDSYDNATTIAYDAADRVTLRWYLLRSGSDSSLDRVVYNSYSYDKLGRQLNVQQSRLLTNGSTSNSDSNEWAAYNAFGELIRKEHVGQDGAIVYNYDAAGRLIDSNENFGVRHFGYNLAGHQVRESHLAALHPDQNNSTVWLTTDAITWNTTDRLGRVTATRLPSHTADTALTTTVQQQLDRWGNALQRTDARGYQTNYRYNEYNQVVRDERPDVEVVSETGDRQILRPVNQWFYDAFGRLTGTRDANNNVRTNTYDAVGRLIQSSDALGNTTRYAFDALGNQRLTQAPTVFEGSYIAFKDYDRNGRLVEIGDYLPTTNAATRTRASQQRYTLNQNGDRTQVFDALGNVARYDYDGRNLIVRSQTAAGVINSYAYDSQGHKVRESNALSGSSTTLDRDNETVNLNELTWNYDVYGRLIDRNDLGGRDYDYFYHHLTGQLAAESQDGGGASMGIRRPRYYANGLIREIVEEGTGGQIFRYEYDAAGNRTMEEVEATDAGQQQVHTVTRTSYDSHNRISQVLQYTVTSGTQKLVFDLGYGYDAVGNRRVVMASSDYGTTSGGGTPPSGGNLPPVYNGGLVNRTAVAGNTVDWLLPAGTFTDPNGDTLTYQLVVEIPAHEEIYKNPQDGGWETRTRPAEWVDAAQAGLSIDGLGRITGRPAVLQGNGWRFNSYNLRVLVRDPSSASAFGAFSLQLNEAPTAPAVGAQNLRVGVAWSLVIPPGSDPNNDPLTYSVQGLPAGIAFDPSTRTLSGTPTTAGSSTVTLTVSDGHGGNTQTSFVLTVADNRPPVMPGISDQNATAGGSYAFELPWASDPDLDPVSFSLSGVPAGLSFNPSTRLLSGTPSTAGDYLLTYTANDGVGGTASTSFWLHVAAPTPVNVAPRVAVAPGSYDMVTGQSGQFFLSPGTFVDDNGDALTYTVVSKPTFLNYSFNASTGHRFYGTPTGTGQRTVVLRATDPSGAYVEVSFTFFIDGGGNRMAAAPSAESSQVQVAEPAAMSMSTQSSTSTPLPGTSLSKRIEYWFTYDGENRIVINNGSLVNGQVQVVRQYDSYAAAYDANGRQIAQTRLDNSGDANSFDIYRARYDLRGNKIQEFHVNAGGDRTEGDFNQARTFKYDANNRLIQSESFYRFGEEREVDNAHGPNEVPIIIQIGGWLESRQTYAYDPDGRITQQLNETRKTDWSKKDFGYDGITDITRDSVIRYTLGDGTTSGYDSAGRIAGYQYLQYKGEAGTQLDYQHTFTSQYEGRDSYLEKTVEGISSNNDYKATTNTLDYDAHGRLRSQIEDTPLKNGSIDKRARYYTYNGEGQVQSRREGTLSQSNVFIQTANQQFRPNYLYAYAAGQSLAELTEAGLNPSLALAPRLSGVGGYQAGGGQQVAAQAGDTLKSLSARIYGSDAYWYVLADANGLSDPGQEIAAGTLLTAPEVKVSRNDANTFKPYDPGQTVGSTTPSLPYIPPPPEAGCGTLGIVLMVAIAIIVTVYTAGAAGSAMGTTMSTTTAAAGTTTGTVAAAGGATAGGFGSVMATGASVLTGGFGTTAMVVGGAAGAFMGSVASQLVGKSLGIIDHFSLRSAVQAGVSAGLTAGLASTPLLENATALLGGSRFAQGAVNAVTGQLTSYAAAKIAGVEASFSWRRIADAVVTTTFTSGLNAAAMPKIGSTLGIDLRTEGGQFAADMIGNTLSGSVAMLVHRKFGLGGDINYGRVLSDAFGNALANAISGTHARLANEASISALSQLSESTSPSGQDAGVRGGFSATPRTHYSENTFENLFNLDPITVTASYNRWTGGWDDWVWSREDQRWIDSYRVLLNAHGPAHGPQVQDWSRPQGIKTPAPAPVVVNKPTWGMKTIAAGMMMADNSIRYGQTTAGVLVGIPVSAAKGVYGLFQWDVMNRGEALYQLTGGYLGQDSHRQMTQTREGLRTFLTSPVEQSKRMIGEWTAETMAAHNRDEHFTVGMRSVEVSMNMVTSVAGGAGAARSAINGTRAMAAGTADIVATMRSLKNIDGPGATPWYGRDLDIDAQPLLGKYFEPSSAVVVDTVLAAEGSGTRGVGSFYATNGDLVQSIATRADNWGIRQGLGNGPVAGTLKHGYAEVLLHRYQRMFGDRGLSAEVRYVNGNSWRPGDPILSSVRLDVVDGPLTNPTNIWDYKFGNAVLSQSRITRIQSSIPNGANVPVTMVKP